jgi:hypothetical protein
MTRLFSCLFALAVVLASAFSFAAPADAHETRNVGPYIFVVGWLAEPAFQGQPNAASVRISDSRATPAKPVEGAEKTLKIEVFSGGLTTPFTGALRAVFGQPGLYALDVIPTVNGSYRYKISGKVETLDVNETFESGPGRFNDVQAASALQFPEKVPAGAELSQQLNQLQSSADQTRALGVVGIVLGLAALGLTLFRRRA